MWKVVFLSLLLLSMLERNQALECAHGNIEKTRTFDTLVQYQANKVPFDFLRTPWAGSYVNFSVASLGTLESNSFVTFDSQHVLKLDLSGKNVRKVEENAFFTLDCLRELDLSRNNITELTRGAFKGLELHLQKLRLNDNRLEKIADLTFLNMSRLKFLELSWNRLHTLEILAFQSLSLLEVLDLSHNRLARIPGEVFAPLVQLSTLDLSHNLLSSVEPQKWQGLQQLGILDLSSNYLSSFDPSYNLTFGKLKMLNLSANSLSEVNVLEMKRHLPQLGLIDLNYNRWKCEYLSAVMQEFRDSNVKLPGNDVGKGDHVEGILCYGATVPGLKTVPTESSKIPIPTGNQSEIEQVLEMNKKLLEENDIIRHLLGNITNLVMFLIVIIVLFVIVEIFIRIGLFERIQKLFQPRTVYLDDSSVSVENLRLLQR